MTAAILLDNHVCDAFICGSPPRAHGEPPCLFSGPPHSLTTRAPLPLGLDALLILLWHDYNYATLLQSAKLLVRFGGASAPPFLGFYDRDLRCTVVYNEGFVADTDVPLPSEPPHSRRLATLAGRRPRSTPPWTHPLVPMLVMYLFSSDHRDMTFRLASNRVPADSWASGPGT